MKDFANVMIRNSEVVILKAWGYFETYQVKKEDEKSINTVLAYISDLKQFRKFYNKDLEDVTTDEIEKYKEYLLSRRLKPKTINRKLVSIRQYIDYLNSNDDIDLKILVEVKLLKIQTQEYLEELLSKNEFDRLVKTAEKENDKRAVAIFYTLYFTGARVSEMLQLKVDDVKQDAILIKGKGDRYRYLFITEELRGYITDYIRGMETEANQLLFINSTNKKPMDRQSVHNLIKKYAGLSKIKLSHAHAHNFRHLYCLRLIEEGIGIEDIAQLAGHKNINTTMIYMRKPKSELMKALKRL
jgi:integrase/recombinase XerD